jgi:L-rhamnose mutarotase
MRVIAFALDLVDDPNAIVEYERCHRQIWPELVTAMKAVGVVSQRIFRSGTRLFMVLEVPDDFDWTERFARYLASTPKATEWDQLMRRFQRPAPAARDDEWWSQMVEVYSLNDYLGGRPSDVELRTADPGGQKTKTRGFATEGTDQ